TVAVLVKLFHSEDGSFSDSNWKRTSKMGQRHWISLFADDVLLFWSNISKSMQMILEVIKLFSEVSGHKTNKAKSSILLLNANERASLLQDTMQFNAATQFRYLGIHI
uniref:Reverse transcriptase domain-containing protein n=1 Tax=Oryzias latipes TaxID=8090 RepID=A0A3B3IAZ9_ORYLA